MDFQTIYFPLEMNEESFVTDTVEHLVAGFAAKGDFKTIADRLKRGARVYQQKADKHNMSNYRYAAEYTAIRDALRDPIMAL